MKRIFLSLLLLVSLAACTAEPTWAPEEDVQRARFVDAGPPTITLFTVINNNSGAGGHSGLLVSGSERVLFDPAGTFYHPYLPERNDVHFGMSDAAVDFYIDYHARITWRVVRQEIVVSPAVAEAALRAVKAHGAVPKAYCANAISSILSDLPGFDTISTTFFPIPLMERFGALPGVTQDVTYDDDPEENGYIIARGIAPL